MKNKICFCLVGINVVNKFRLLLEFCWESSGGKNILFAWWVVAKLSMFMGSGNLIMVGHRWLWVVMVK